MYIVKKVEKACRCGIMLHVVTYLKTDWREGSLKNLQIQIHFEIVAYFVGLVDLGK